MSQSEFHSQPLFINSSLIANKLRDFLLRIEIISIDNLSKGPTPVRILRKSIWWEMTKKYVLSEKNTWYHILSQKVQGFDRNDVIYFLKYRVMIEQQ